MNAGALEAAARLVATDVGDDDALGAGLPALADDLGDHFRVGVGGLLRGAVPGDVGLDDHDVLAADEALHAAKIRESTLHEGARFAALDHGQVRKLWGAAALTGAYAMVAPRLLGQRRNGPEAVPAEPDGSRAGARGHAAHAQQLQHRLAAGQRRRLGIPYCDQLARPSLLLPIRFRSG